jgi:UDP-N-acetylmuramoyl-tripeptide--D-alanyl-D-alanine ligase
MKLSLDSFNDLKSQKEKIFILGQMAELGEFSENEHKKILEKISKMEGEKILIGEEFLKLKDRHPSFKYFLSLEQLKDFLEKSPLENKLILVKGSNSVGLSNLEKEKVI